MELTEEFEWRGRRVRWGRAGEGPPVVFCHGTPWSSWLWRPYAEALAARVHGAPVGHAGLRPRPRRTPTTGSRSTSRASCSPTCSTTGAWTRRTSSRTTTAARSRCGRTCCTSGRTPRSRWSTSSPSRRGGRTTSGWSGTTPTCSPPYPPAIHEGALRAYVAGASHRGLRPDELDRLVAPWLDAEGQPAFYRQIAQADQALHRRGRAAVRRARPARARGLGHRRHLDPGRPGTPPGDTIPGAELRLIEGAGHLVQLDQPVALATTLDRLAARPGQLARSGSRAAASRPGCARRRPGRARAAGRRPRTAARRGRRRCWTRRGGTRRSGPRRPATWPGGCCRGCRCRRRRPP